MNELNLNNLKVIEKISYPYPIIIYSNLLNESQIHDLEKCLSMKEMMYDKTVMGNRKTLLKGTDNFEQFINRNEIGQKINNFFENIEVFNFFYKNLQRLNLRNSEHFDFKNKNFKFLKNYIKRNNSLSFRLKNKFTKTLISIKKSCGVYCDFDFSAAGEGYEREPHHDVEERIVNFLYYVNDFDGLNGGNFQIFKYKNKPVNYLRQPDLNDVEILKNLKPQKGHLVTFLSTPSSLHGVDTIKSTMEKRYFFYGSYTSINKVDWKKII